MTRGAPVGEAAVEKVHARGKLTARERIYALLDEGSFVELDPLARHRSTYFGLDDKRPLGDGVVTGYDTIEGRDVCVFSQDATVFGGSLGEVYGEKILKVQELPIKTGRPIIGINDGAGARIHVIKTVTGEDVTMEELGGVSSSRSSSVIVGQQIAEQVADEVERVVLAGGGVVRQPGLGHNARGHPADPRRKTNSWKSKRVTPKTTSSAWGASRAAASASSQLAAAARNGEHVDPSWSATPAARIE